MTYKEKMKGLENLRDIFAGCVKPDTSDIESIVQFFNENNPEEYDLRDQIKCKKRVEELMNELEELGEAEFNFSEDE